MPKISVIVPIYNVEAYLKRCVDSILGQTFCDFELILVDDGSPDCCGKICDEYAKKDNRIVVIHKENGGLADARNAGIDWVFENSNSEWITFIDSDDWVHMQYLELLYNGVRQGKTDICCCHSLKTARADVTISPLLNEKPIIVYANQAFLENASYFYSAWGKIYKKTLFKNERFPKGRLYEDGALLTKLMFNSKNIAVYDAQLYYYFVNPGSITNVPKTEKHFIDRACASETQIQFLVEKKYINECRHTLKNRFKDIQYSMYVYSKKRNIQRLLKKQKKDLFNMLENAGTEIDYKKLYADTLIKTKKMIAHGILSDVKKIKESRGCVYAMLYKVKHFFVLQIFQA